jgi:hypothetical protein
MAAPPLPMTATRSAPSPPLRLPLVKASTFDAGISAAAPADTPDIRDAFCCHVHFFASAATGQLSGALAALTCPCHLPIVLLAAPRPEHRRAGHPHATRGVRDALHRGSLFLQEPLTLQRLVCA